MTLGITHILTVASNVGPSPFPDTFKYTVIDVEDRMSVNLAAHFNKAFAVIDEGVKAGGILVHCLAGTINFILSQPFVCASLQLSSSMTASTVSRIRHAYVFASGLPSSVLSRSCTHRFAMPSIGVCPPAGMSRSVTIVTAYLMKRKGWDLRYALGHVKAKRPIAQPNLGFMRQLQEYESALEWEEDEQTYKARTMKNTLDSWYS